MDSASVGSMHVDAFRVGVKLPVWDTLVDRFERLGVDADVTLRSISLGSRDSWSGWRAITYSESTIQAAQFPRGSSFNYESVGVYAREDMMFLTPDVVCQYDQIETEAGYFTVGSVQEHFTFDSFLFRELQCSRHPLYESVPAATTWSLTRGSDPRYRTKVYIDTYVRDAQITEDDDSTEASWACIFADPLYPLELEFRSDSLMHGLYVVDRPEVSPIMSGLSQAPIGYRELVPIKIYTVDSTDVTGTALNWKMEAELRYVLETYPTGSLRGPSRMRGRPVQFGGFTVYETELILDYKRDTST